MMTRRGMMMVELAVAGVLVGTLLVVGLQLLSAAMAQRRVADQRQCALLELGNLMEQIAARPWTELTTAALARERLSPSAVAQLPGAELKIEVSAPAHEPHAKRLTAALRWQGRSGQLLPPVTLTTWRYKIID
jgi:type II secretory pathway pseudopilin PulG